MTSGSDCRTEAAHLETEMYPLLQGPRGEPECLFREV